MSTRQTSTGDASALMFDRISGAVRGLLCLLLLVVAATEARAEPPGQRFVSIAFHDIVDQPAELTPDAVTTVFDGMTRLTNRGIPVVIIHHESEHGSSKPGGPSMGASVIVQKARTWMQVRQTAKRKLRGGNMALVIQGNGLGQPQQVVAEPMTGPTYRVLNRGPWAAEDKPKPDSLDQNSRVAVWIVDNCQGLGVNKVAPALAKEFPSRPWTTWKDQLVRGELATLLIREGKGTDTSWRAAA